MRMEFLRENSACGNFQRAAIPPFRESKVNPI